MKQSEKKERKKKTNNRFVSCFAVLGENGIYVIYCFIECGLFIWHVFDYCFINTQFWNAKFQDANEQNMYYLLVPKSQKSWGKSGGQESDLSGQAPLSLI